MTGPGPGMSTEDVAGRRPIAPVPSVARCTKAGLIEADYAEVKALADALEIGEVTA